MSSPSTLLESRPELDIFSFYQALPRGGDYKDHGQPIYDDEALLLETMLELQSTGAVTNPRQVDRVQGYLTRLATGESSDVLITTGRCHEPVDIKTGIDTLVANAIGEHQLVMTAMPRARHIIRNRGMSAKIRSNEKEALPNGDVVLSFMGDAINRPDPELRRPDPRLMVASAVQARDIERGILNTHGEHIPAAHEALLLAYEYSFLERDDETGEVYSSSADQLWAGYRTRNHRGPHIQLLSHINNPVAVKLGPDTEPDEIDALKAALNPDEIPGRLSFMLRTGPNHTDKLSRLAQRIALVAPESIREYDIHGVTETIDGMKIRSVPAIIDDIRVTAEICNEEGLELHGAHLETRFDDIDSAGRKRIECPDEIGEFPTHPGGLDPQLSRSQLARVLGETAGFYR